VMRWSHFNPLSYLGTALKKTELKYRYPYQARHTFATKNIREGRDPLWIANQMGTSLEMLFKHYAVYFRKKHLSQSTQTSELFSRRRTRLKTGRK